MIFLFKYCTDVENYESFRDFGFIYIYIYIYIDFRIMLEIQIILQTADVVSGYWEMKKIY